MQEKAKTPTLKASLKKTKKIGLKVWQGISKFVKMKSAKRPQPKNLHISKRTETNSPKIASEFNSFFNTTAAEIDGKIISTSLTFREPTDYVSPTNHSNWS